MKIDDKGQSSGEIILLIGGILVILILIGSYISNITNSIEDNLKKLLIKERDYILNMI